MFKYVTSFYFFLIAQYLRSTKRIWGKRKCTLKIHKIIDPMKSKKLSTQVFKYSSTQVFKYSSIQVFKYSNIQVFKYSNIQIFNLQKITKTLLHIKLRNLSQKLYFKAKIAKHPSALPGLPAH